MELVNKTDIQRYAERNTSAKMPIEKKYVQAFLDALLNSTSVQDVYKILMDELQNGNSYIIYNSFFPTAKNVNREPYRSIIAYSMLKKDIRLFELISASIFTGSVTEYHGTDLYSEVTFNTDEIPTKYTDTGIYTDMSEGLIQIGFKNYYCDDPLEDGTGSEYQNIKELEDACIAFDSIITLTKPARVEVLLFFVPWMYMSGNANKLLTCGIKRDDENLSSPFGDPVSMNILDGMSTPEIVELYREVSMYDYEHKLDRTIDFEKKITLKNDAIYFDYDFKVLASASSSETTTKDVIWGTIKILSSAGSKIYSRKTTYKPEEEYYEKYNPIMLKINQDDPDSPCLALEIENGMATVGALFYTRDKR